MRQKHGKVASKGANPHLRLPKRCPTEPVGPVVAYMKEETAELHGFKFVITMTLLLMLIAMLTQTNAPGTPAEGAPTHAPEATTAPHLEKAMFGAGCFWGVEETFRATKGVKETAVGYSGGHTEHPTYKEVCSDKTGHAEVVQVTYDPAMVSYDQLLTVFWENHNPTQMNRQGPDVGTQYRSAIFYYTDAQQKAAEASKAKLAASPKYAGRQIATVVEPAKPFFRAEEYHQKYLAKRGLSSCHL